jgi:hypothetical protein
MALFDFLALTVLVLSVCAVVVVERILGLRRRTSDHQTQLAELHAQQLIERINELERHNDELRQQLEWNRRLLEAQDRVLQQLGAPASRV